MARPKAFRVDTAVDRAMELFWLKGYGGTSLHDLLSRMRIGRQSLYDTFGSKRDLYLRALDRYREFPVQRALAGLEASTAGPGDVPAFFRRLVASQAGGPALGCLMVGAAQELAGSDPEVARRVARHRRRTEAAFENALLGSVPPADLPSVATHLAVLADALLLAARGGAGRAALDSIARLAADAVAKARGSLPENVPS